MITHHLKHRATVSRKTMQDNDGSPIFVWADVATDLPCLWTPGEPLQDPTATTAQVTESKRHGVLLTAHTANVQPNDRLTITRPSGGVQLEVLADASTVLGFDQPSHREWQVRTL